MTILGMHRFNSLQTGKCIQSDIETETVRDPTKFWTHVVSIPFKRESVFRDSTEPRDNVYSLQTGKCINSL